MFKSKIFAILVIIFLVSTTAVLADSNEQGFLSKLYNWIISLFKDDSGNILKENITDSTNLEYICDYEIKQKHVKKYKPCQIVTDVQVCNEGNTSCWLTQVNETNSCFDYIEIQNETICKRKGIKASEREILFDNENIRCNICNSTKGNKEEIVCWSVLDGWAENKQDWSSCECLSGESCGIYNKNGKLKGVDD